MRQTERRELPVEASGAEQLVFTLDHRPALGRDDFLVAPCNEDAVAAIDRWPDWPARMMAIFGPAGAGKSHLAHVWRKASDARLARAHELTKRQVPGLFSGDAVVIEDGERLTDEQSLLHVINMVFQNDAYLLLTGRTAPGLWSVDLVDLKSRLQVIPAIELGQPCDALLGGVLVKMFEDRQLDVPSDVIDFLVGRMERSFDAAQQLVRLIDLESMAQKRKISRKLAGEILERLNC